MLTSDVVVRGTVRFGAPQLVSLATSALKKASGTVTAAPVKAATLSEGGVAMAVSGRPVFVLRGAQPAYRDLGPGAVGTDVRQLEEALGRLGFEPGPIDGTYDTRTESAVTAWYRAAGWTALGPTDEQLQLKRTTQAELSTAQSDLIGAQEGLVISLAALARAAPAVEEAARAKAHADRQAAAAEVVSRTSALDAALGDEQVAQARLHEARTADPPAMGAELAALETTTRQAAGTVRAARAALAAAQAAVVAVGSPPAPGSWVTEAARAAAAADAEVDRATGAVPLAERKVAVIAGRANGAPLGELGGKLGIQVPADEVLFFPDLPLRIDEAKVRPGDAPAGPVMTVTNSRLAVDAALSAADAKLVRTGDAVAVTEPEVGLKTTGTVTEVADTPGTKGVDPQRFYLEVAPADASAAVLGASVVLTITVESTGGEVLAVPVSALTLAGDGSSRVEVIGGDGTPRFAPVTPGLAAKGMVAVTPGGGGGLAPGDLVVVGTPAATKPTKPGGSNAP